MGVLIPQEFLGVKEPKRKWLFWGDDICPLCRKNLTKSYGEPEWLTLGMGENYKKKMSLVTYSCPCGYIFQEYEDNYYGSWLSSNQWD